jgi:hypothetical protein
MNRRVYRWAFAGCALVFITAGITGACTSSTVPPKLTEEDLARVHATHFPWTLGVERYKLPAYSDSLIASLRRTGLFDRVDELDKVPEASVVARVRTEIYGNAVIPLWTCLSIGVVPTITVEQHGHAFSLAPRCCSDRAVAVDFRYSGPTVLGWFAMLKNFGPDSTRKSPYDHARFHAALANALSLHASEIGSLAQSRE